MNVDTMRLSIDQTITVVSLDGPDASRLGDAVTRSLIRHSAWAIIVPSFFPVSCFFFVGKQILGFLLRGNSDAMRLSHPNGLNFSSVIQHQTVSRKPNRYCLPDAYFTTYERIDYFYSNCFGSFPNFKQAIPKSRNCNMGSSTKVMIA